MPIGGGCGGGGREENEGPVKAGKYVFLPRVVRTAGACGKCVTRGFPVRAHSKRGSGIRAEA
jgi:hypothetical protein